MSKKSQFGMTLLLLVGGANASTVSTSNTLGAAMIAQQGAVCKGVVKDSSCCRLRYTEEGKPLWCCCQRGW